jgi:hypothetical protein
VAREPQHARWRVRANGAAWPAVAVAAHAVAQAAVLRVGGVQRAPARDGEAGLQVEVRLHRQQ